MKEFNNGPKFYLEKQRRTSSNFKLIYNDAIIITEFSQYHFEKTMHQDYLFYRNPGLYKPDDYRIKYELIDDTSSNSNLIDQYILFNNNKNIDKLKV
ncbi:hypothetical protein RhiirA5_435882 [Rhizophagus irregularis]|uniref:Uncharacterized protein n=1 Tax=Rhizophagus irregularis TaxID=588596 RepID=A0A2I1EY74_9GLOM|nr:hypothetical protein RhiirA5_435882 [Rhizophagus irregularis]PKY27074.1 hypothetical protein RhiirB3_442643 [Rhizophagus irregularis]GBC22294.2 hypothetical protein RIR_jg14378.t1 [Rhizophagus irregularis DAOM 181602=DAOM 197198]